MGGDSPEGTAIGRRESKKLGPPPPEQEPAAAEPLAPYDIAEGEGSAGSDDDDGPRMIDSKGEGGGLDMSAYEQGAGVAAGPRPASSPEAVGRPRTPCFVGEEGGGLDEFEYAVFLSHDHSDESQKKVQELSEQLTDAGLKSYVREGGDHDEDWMQAMCVSGIVICAVTQTYMDKVGMWTSTPGLESRCKKEFAYACKIVQPAFILPISLEDELDWVVGGPVGRLLGPSYLIHSLDLSTTDDTSVGLVLKEIVQVVQGLIERRRETEKKVEYDTTPSVIESLKELLKDEKGVKQLEFDKTVRESGDDDNVKAMLLRQGLDEIEAYEDKLAKIFEIDNAKQKLLHEQALLKRQAEELTRKADEELVAQMKKLEKEKVKQDFEFQKRLEAKKQKRKEKRDSEAPKASKDGPEGDGAGSEEQRSAEEIAEEEKMVKEQKSMVVEQEKLMQAIKDEYEKGQEEVKRLTQKKEEVDRQVEEKRSELTKAQQEAEKLIPDIHKRLEMVKKHKALAKKQQEAIAKQEQEMQHMEAVQRKKEEQLRAKEQEYIRRAMDVEQRRIKIAEEEEQKKAQKAKQLKELEESRKASRQRKQEEENKRLNDLQDQYRNDSSNFLQKRSQELQKEKPKKPHAPRQPPPKMFSKLPTASTSGNAGTTPGAAPGASAFPKKAKIDDWTGKTISTLKSTLRSEKGKLKGNEVLALHFTSDFGAHAICNTGIRASAEGQGGGGFYFVLADKFLHVLQSESRKFDRECFRRIAIALYGVVNAEDVKYDRMNIVLFLALPKFLVQEVPIEEGDERSDICELHYVPTERIRELGGYQEDENGNLLVHEWSKKVSKNLRLFSETNQKTKPKLNSIQDVYEQMKTDTVPPPSGDDPGSDPTESPKKKPGGPTPKKPQADPKEADPELEARRLELEREKKELEDKKQEIERQKREMEEQARIAEAEREQQKREAEQQKRDAEEAARQQQLQEAKDKAAEAERLLEEKKMETERLLEQQQKEREEQLREVQSKYEESQNRFEDLQRQMRQQDEDRKAQLEEERKRFQEAEEARLKREEEIRAEERQKQEEMEEKRLEDLKKLFEEERKKSQESDRGEIAMLKQQLEEMREHGLAAQREREAEAQRQKEQQKLEKQTALEREVDSLKQQLKQFLGQGGMPWGAADASYTPTVDSSVHTVSPQSLDSSISHAAWGNDGAPPAERPHYQPPPMHRKDSKLVPLPRQPSLLAPLPRQGSQLPLGVLPTPPHARAPGVLGAVAPPANLQPPAVPTVAPAAPTIQDPPLATPQDPPPTPAQPAAAASTPQPPQPAATAPPPAQEPKSRTCVLQ